MLQFCLVFGGANRNKIHFVKKRVTFYATIIKITDLEYLRLLPKGAGDERRECVGL